MKNDNDALIGKIYETALSPGDWVELLDTIAGWTEVEEGFPIEQGLQNRPWCLARHRVVQKWKA
ncbi:hypothetical protein A3730_18530 [Alcanivorax sp. HI0044]|uniref:hypothetical protein n=1 Tax=Alcanivorax sp. HI0044 TaxID=1822234 RepID=UPI0007BA4701|nr:hypothetical protein [Alcanivorax sp. HI0044]KZY32477.1 hypothetical protein A3730_18530 [Alcanivorax sp. HI0044]